MNASQGLVKAYRIEDAAGVLQYVAVVNGAADGNCKKPAAANAQGFLGFTLEAQPNQYKGVAVQKSGIARATANGSITRGDAVAIATSAGDVKSVQAVVSAGPGTASTNYVIGSAEESAVNGQTFAVWVNPGVVAIAAS